MLFFLIFSDQSIVGPKDVVEKVGGLASFKCKLPQDGAPVLWMHKPIRNMQNLNGMYELGTYVLAVVLLFLEL